MSNPDNITIRGLTALTFAVHIGVPLRAYGHEGDHTISDLDDVTEREADTLLGDDVNLLYVETTRGIARLFIEDARRDNWRDMHAAAANIAAALGEEG